ncbi:hypothetical protein SAMN05192534_10221 [Alteribacillus persepolensis]|uniref:Di-and tricarboxylate transporter n=1 Tax=Alteribacillus persepolensis TaxID=568899 RepID=A0A1G8A4H4_9BACI|nr:hypothetical protein [Alteribacillus persepolensis]SDH15885.1 hypothetical protein SAMN05192534_10221 [Alteribacillus persepolensis]
MIRYIFLLAIGLYLLSNIIHHPVLDVFVSIVALCAVVCSVFFVRSIVLMFGLIFLSSGILLLSFSHSAVTSYLFAFGEMLNLLTLFALIPILALPIRLGNYAGEVKAVIQKKIKNSMQLYMMSSGISYFLSSFMNLAALPMTYYSIRPSIDEYAVYNKERFMSRSITHGFAMPLLWTPVTPIVGIVLEMTGVNYSSILPVLIPLSVLGLLVDWLIVRVHTIPSQVSREEFSGVEAAESSKQEMAAATEDTEDKSVYRLFHIFLAIILLNITILIVEQFADVSFLFLISLLVIPFSFIWTLLIKKQREYVHALGNHFQTHVTKMKDQFFLFLSAGFFISALNISGADQTVNQWISSIIDVIGVHAFLAVLPFIPAGLAFIGLHPAVAFVLIVEAVNPHVLGLSPLVLTIAMLGSAVPAFLMGPYNATLGVMSNIIDQSPFKISNWNIPFSLTYMVILIVFLQAAQYIFS